ncbi:MAG: glycoside hydrolase family 3 N-terminal domain-containing protein [Thermoanaerobaculia bacterium]
MHRLLRSTCLLWMLLAVAMAMPVAESLAAPASNSVGHELAPLPLPKAARKWVDSTLASLSLHEKAAQLVMVRANGRYQNPASMQYRDLVSEVRDLGVGGVVVFRSELESIPRLLNELQATAEVPLLVSADVERGMAFRVPEGTVPLPWAMAVGASRSEEAARFTGEVTAREGRALGIHWALAPVADVNNNPANPVINIRSYGEDPELVARMVRSYIEGAREGGILTTAKHFPGHGDTSSDSHYERPVVGVDRERLESVELVPFRAAVEAGVDSIMTAHVALPSIDPSGAPATLSPSISRDLLRDELGFDGLIVTDALEMAGIRPAWAGEAAVRSVQAGADVVLLPADVRVAIQSLVRAVEEGQLTEERLDISVRRILEAKARLGLHKNRLVDREALGRSVARPQDLDRALEVAETSITVIRNDRDILPLKAEEPLRILHVVISTGLRDRAIQGLPEAELRARGIQTKTFTLGREVSPETMDKILEVAPDYTHVLVSSFIWVKSSNDLSPSQTRLIQRLGETGRPVIVLSFGSPYFLAEIPEVPVFVTAYGSAASSQQAAVAALFGEFDVQGKLPVTLPDLYPYGHGIELARREMTLPRALPEEAGFRPGGLEEVDRVLQGFLEQQAFPGGVLAVGYQGKLAHLEPFGRLSYDEGAPEVTTDTIYDLASLTKVVATTMMAMILVDEGSLDLDKPVVDYLPLFVGPGKEKVSVRQLLTHSSGLVAYGDLYNEISGKKAYLERIQGMELDYDPGTKSVYSDYGMILLGEILERVAGQPMDVFLEERVYGPLGMTDTGFLPADDLLERIAPTEDDPWRGYRVRGEVHDENAHALGGVAPHAGLFSTATDLSRFLQMILNGGVFENQRIVSRQIVEEWTRRAGIPDSDRATGWDTKSAEKSSAGSFFSPNSFGHLGYTGTSMWVDPERDLFVILLTNRVHPSRENNLIRQARPAVADAVVRALDIPLVQVGLERIDSGELGSLVGKRLGLVAHAASVTSGGRHAIDVLRDQSLNVVRLFSPEHGLRGRAAAGEPVESGADPISGLPVVSLYGDQRRPSAESLAGLDALVFDLQGAGVRFYTYVSTLIHCLEAAAEAGLELVVLDRPNPLGGLRIEGPVSAPRDVVPASFVNLAPGPLIHGLTLGEMARFVNSQLEVPANLTVVPMVGWSRKMTWAETGREWVSPSPNLRSAEASLAYPGTALLEATNLSEGRGTEDPFLLFGAPWLKPGELHLSVPGFSLEAVRFSPVASEAAPYPKFEDQECNGWRVRVPDRQAAAPYALGVTLLHGLLGHTDFEWLRNGDVLTRLTGTPTLLEHLQAGKTVEEILAADSADHATWSEARKRALLY